jgi:hypothetical protein
MIGHVSVFAAALVAAGAAALSFPPSTTCDGRQAPQRSKPTVIVRADVNSAHRFWTTEAARVGSRHDAAFERHPRAPATD